MTETILVVGAAGAIGRALALQARQRHRDAVVIGTCRSPDDVDDQQPFDRLLGLDLGDDAAIASAAEEVATHVDRLDWMWVASGLLHALPALAPEKQVEDLDGPRLEKVFRINTIAPLLLARHFLPLLNHSGRSVLAFLAARVGSIGDNRLGGWYGYRASKAALVMANRTLAHETARRAPRLIPVCLHPGTVDSPLSAPFQRRLPKGQVATPEAAAGNLWRVAEGLGPEHAGHHLAWDGQVIPW